MTHGELVSNLTPSQPERRNPCSLPLKQGEFINKPHSQTRRIHQQASTFVRSTHTPLHQLPVIIVASSTSPLITEFAQLATS